MELKKQDENVLTMAPSRFEQFKSMAEYFAKSNLVPQHFQGNPANVFIALQYAARMNLDPFLVMQSIYVVHGRPGWEGKFLLSLVNNSGKFNAALDFEWTGKEGKPDWGCRAVATKGRRTIYGPWVTWKMVEAEGWNKDKPMRDGKGVIKSKWNTMPELMFKYRAAAYFCNTNCPEVKLGLPTKEELVDAEIDMLATPEGVFVSNDAIQSFWDLYDQAEGRELQKNNSDRIATGLFKEFMDDTCRILGFESHELLMEQALNDFTEFYASWERYKAKAFSGEPETAPSPEPTSSEPQEATNNPEPMVGETPATQAQLALVEGYLKSKNVDDHKVFSRYGILSLQDLSFDQADDCLVWLKNF